VDKRLCTESRKARQREVGVTLFELLAEVYGDLDFLALCLFSSVRLKKSQNDVPKRCTDISSILTVQYEEHEVSTPSDRWQFTKQHSTPLPLYVQAPPSIGRNVVVWCVGVGEGVFARFTKMSYS
jgi:hypothetical protein